MKHAVALVFLLAVSGCKSNLWKDVSEHAHTDAELERERRLCLGVTVSRETHPLALGVAVERVLRESPADAAGLAVGDEIRSVGTYLTRSPHELDGALRALRRGSGDNVGESGPPVVDVVIASGGEERIVRCRLTTWGDQLRLARERCQTHAKTYESKVTVPFIVDYERLAIAVDMYRDYFGLSLKEPLLLYRDVDVVPLFGFFSLVRFERSSFRDAWRLQLLMWPAKFTTISDNESLRELLAPGEDRLEVF